MKTKFLNTIGILAIALSAGTASAQNLPNSFNYQAVITADDGTPVSNHDITVEVSILQDNDCENGPTLLWQELHSSKTNDFGCFSIEIGDNNAINTTAGSLSKYSDIDWLDTQNGFYYLQVRVDFGEATYLNGMTDLGTTKFSAVLATDANGNIGNKLGQLADVTINTPKANQILVYDATLQAWKNTDPAAAQGLTNINISSPKTGDHLVYNETNGKWENKTIATPKLGDLADVKNMTRVNGGEILYYDGDGEEWKNKALTLNDIQGVSAKDPKNGQVLTFDQGFWVAQNAATAVTKLSQLTDDVTIHTTKPANIGRQRTPPPRQATSGSPTTTKTYTPTPNTETLASAQASQKLCYTYKTATTTPYSTQEASQSAAVSIG